MEALRNRERAGHFEWHVANEESVCGPLLLNANNPFDLEDLAQHAMVNQEKYLVRLGPLGPWVSVGAEGEGLTPKWYVRHRSDKWQKLEHGPSYAPRWQRNQEAQRRPESEPWSSCLTDTLQRVPLDPRSFQVAFLVCRCAPALQCPEILYQQHLDSQEELQRLQVTLPNINVWTLNPEILLLVDPHTKRIMYFEPSDDRMLEDDVLQRLQRHPQLREYDWWKMVTSNQTTQFPPDTIPSVSYLLHALVALRSPSKVRQHLNQVFPSSLFQNPFLNDLSILTQEFTAILRKKREEEEEKEQEEMLL